MAIIAVISDIHSNLEALDAVLRDIEKRRVANILFLGDAVGYGANPNEVVNLIKTMCDFGIAGNHDHAALGITDISNFNERAADAIMWTFEVLGEKEAAFLEKQPFTRDLEGQNLFLAHGTPFEPEQWHYLITPEAVEMSFNFFTRRCCLVGHSHRPFIIEKNSSGQLVGHDREVFFTQDSRYAINIGSVGQPRDGDPRACYLLLDEERAKLIRVEYEIEKAQRKILDAGLPPQLAKRLARGA